MLPSLNLKGGIAAGIGSDHDGIEGVSTNLPGFKDQFGYSTSNTFFDANMRQTKSILKGKTSDRGGSKINKITGDVSFSIASDPNKYRFRANMITNNTNAQNNMNLTT